jgi:hypothetical protein
MKTIPARAVGRYAELKTARCWGCDELFRYLPSQSTGKFCSWKCINIWKKEGASDRFWSRVIVAGPNACWLWRGAKRYGHFTIGYRMVGAHVFALELKLGRRLRRGEFALHSCDNPPCVNPNHLFVGNAEVNSHDMVDKGRHRNQHS